VKQQTSANNRWRGLVTPAKRGKGVKLIARRDDRASAERHAAMTRAQRFMQLTR
jgi:hypothetical protein